MAGDNSTFFPPAGEVIFGPELNETPDRGVPPDKGVPILF